MLKNIFYVFFLTITLVSCQKEPSNDYQGIWQIIKVETDGKKQKPVAYWIESQDSTFVRGDGNYALDSGKWLISPKDILLLESAKGKERDSEWSLSFRGDTLIMTGTSTKSNSYKRTMEAIQVNARPIHFRDQVVGKWSYDEILIDSIPLPKRENAWIEFSANRIWYSQSDSGLWSMNAYAPILDVNDKNGQPLNQWFMVAKKDSMSLMGTSTLNQENLEAKLLRIK